MRTRPLLSTSGKLVSWRKQPGLLAFAWFFAVCVLAQPPACASSIVRFSTNLGDIDVRLFGNATPISVDNFLDLIDAAAYQDAIIARSVPGFVIQGGGFRLENNLVNSAPLPPAENLPVINEPILTNLRGTIAYAKRPAFDQFGNPVPGGGPDSATNQWFFSLGDNSANLDAQNGGFTVFGRVVRGLDVVDQIAALPRGDLSSLLGSFGGSFTTTPLNDLADLDNDGQITLNDVRINNFVTLDITRTTFDSADYNLDGTVDIEDFDVFRSEFGNSLHISDHLAGSPGIDLASDGNGNARVNAADYVVLRDSISALPGVAPAVIAVPEPATLGGLAFLLLPAALRRRRFSGRA